MLKIKCTCPYCFNVGSLAESLGPIRQSEEVNIGGVKKRLVSTYAVVSCCKCHEVFVVFFKDYETLYKAAREALKNWEKSVYLRPTVERTLPEPEEPPTEEVYPKKINRFLEIIHRHLKTAPDLKPEDAAVIVSNVRSVLECSLKDLGIGEEGDKLYKRIEKAYEEGLITRVIKEWADIVRKWGNKAVHELEVSPEEALEAYEFMKFMLYFLYKVPAEVEKYKRS